jgi:cyclopropane-fatty-acyl-phospholipid synthase
VGREYWPAFFATVRDRLRSGGTAALQVITIAEEQFQRYQRSVDYIQKYIFPGGMLPSKAALGDQVRQAGLCLRDSAGFGPDYAETLREWNRRFQRAWPELKPLGFDARFKRMWEQYLHYCAAGFAVGSIDVVQMAVRRP